MALNFRKSIKIAPGIRMNLSKGGIGMSAGVKGARVGVNKRGTYTSTSLPGTGISSFSYHNKSGKKAGNRLAQISNNSSVESNKKIYLGIAGVILLLIAPWLILFYVIGGAYYFFNRNKSPKYQAEKLFRQAKIAFEQGDFDEALNLLKDSERTYPDTPGLSFLFGGTYNNLKKYDNAIPYLEKALAEDPKDKMVILGLANCYLSQEDYGKVVPLIQSFPDGWENELKAIQILGLAFAGQKHFDLSIEVFKKAPLLKRNLDHDLLELHYNLARVYERSGDKKNALKHYKKVYAYDMEYKAVSSKVSELNYE